MDGSSFQKPVLPLHIDHLHLVVGHIDVRRVELAESSHCIEQCLDIPSLGWGNQFEGKQRSLCLVEDVYHLHGISIPYH